MPLLQRELRTEMIAVDTNILVRLLTEDDPDQVNRAVAIMERGEVFISKTVLLETEWVLRHGYEIEPVKINEAFTNLLGLPNATVEDSSVVAQAISWHENGLDFADALHLASSTNADEFYTFDRSLAKSGRNIEAIKVVLA